jgi:hypothetical protein
VADRRYRSVRQGRVHNQARTSSPYYTGQRRHDRVQIDWSRFNGERIEVVCQSKGGGYLSIPCHSVLLVELLPFRKAKGPVHRSRDHGDHRP